MLHMLSGRVRDLTPPHPITGQPLYNLTHSRPPQAMCALARMTGFKKSQFSSGLRMVIMSRSCWFFQSFMCLPLKRFVPCVNNINIVINLEVFHCSRKSNHLTCMIDESGSDISTDCRTTEITIFREIIFPLEKKRGVF